MSNTQDTLTALLGRGDIVRRLHSFPVGGDEPLHICSPRCWCFPVRDSEYSGFWIHNAKDCREAKERIGAVDMLDADSLWALALENVEHTAKLTGGTLSAPDFAETASVPEETL